MGRIKTVRPRLCGAMYLLVYVASLIVYEYSHITTCNARTLSRPP